MKNYTKNPEVKEFTYYETNQRFKENNITEGTYTENSFMIKEKNEKIIHHGNATIVILDDGSKGVAKCCEKDEYDKLKGVKIAYIRAKIKSLQKELKQLVK